MLLSYEKLVPPQGGASPQLVLVLFVVVINDAEVLGKVEDHVNNLLLQQVDRHGDDR